MTLALAASATGLANPTTGPASASPVAPTLERFVLDNGLRVVVDEDHRLPVAGIAELFDVGSRDEWPGEYGFAHLFEHLMFEGSANAPKGTYDRIVNGNGGDDNAWTSEDDTCYHLVVPSNLFATALWLEADRVRALAVTPESLANQIHVVEEEFRQRVYNEPYAQAEIDLHAAVYAGSPYAHDTLGTFHDLDAASLARVSAFHDGFYGPQNMVLVVVGDVRPDEVRRAVEQGFGTIRRRETPARPSLAPPDAAPAHLDESDRLAELPVWMAAYRIPPDHTPDHDALDLLGQILAGGEAARLERRLVDEQRIATHVDAAPDGRRGTDTFSLEVTLLAGHTPAEARTAVEAELALLARDGVTAEELERARNQLTLGLVSDLRSHVDRAIALGLAAINRGEPALAYAPIEAWGRVTAKDVQRVAAIYLTPSSRSDAFVLPAR